MSNVAKCPICDRVRPINGNFGWCYLCVTNVKMHVTREMESPGHLTDWRVAVELKEKRLGLMRRPRSVEDKLVVQHKKKKRGVAA